VLSSGTGMLTEGIRRTGRKEGKINVQMSVESTWKRCTRMMEGGLCHGVILLHENKGDDISGVGILRDKGIV
jgi:hypothetical protein